MPDRSDMHDSHRAGNGAGTALDEPGAEGAADSEDDLAAGTDAPYATGEGPHRIESLDAELAHAADDLIAGEFADEDEVYRGEEKTGAPVASVSAAPVETPAETPVAAAVVEAVEPEPLPEPSPEASPEAPVEPAAEAPAAEDPPEPARRPVAEPLPLPAPMLPREAPAGRARRGLLARALSPLLRGVLCVTGAISWPLRDRPGYVRDGVGWLALANLMFAACVWVYIGAIRSPEPPEPAPLPTRHEPQGAHAPKAKKAEGKPKPAAKGGHGASGGH